MCEIGKPLTDSADQDSKERKSFSDRDGGAGGAQVNSGNGGASGASRNETMLDVDPAIVPMGRYKPLQMLGQGALGRVYLCLDKHLQKPVAVKTLLSVTDDRVVSFQNEARIASRLQHESVIQILDFGVTDSGRPFMVMEYFPSRSLEDLLLEEGPLEERDALEIFILITEALACLHENGVFHRDLKPSNILVGNGEQNQFSVRVIDFNLSKTSRDIQSKTIVQGRTVVGTPAYMSPDQIAGQKYDAKSEVYSMGCLMYEVLTGEPPFTGENALEILNKHAKEELVPPQEVQPQLSDQLNDIIERCLQKSRDQRYANMKELLKDLNACARDTAGGAGFGGSVSRGTGFAGAPYSGSSRSEVRPKSGALASSKMFILGAGAIGLSIICWGYFVMNSAKQTELPKIRFAQDNSPAHEFGDSITNDLSDCRHLVEEAIQNKSEKVKLPYSCTDDDLKVLEGNSSIQELSIHDSVSLTDATCRIAATMPNLRRLELDGTGVETLEGIGGCRNLELLSLNRTQINDESAKNLKGLDKLFWLRVCKTKVTNQFLSNLPALPQLSDITIGGNLTDECVPDLARQTHLTYLHIGTSKITPNGLRKLVSTLKHVMAVDTGGSKMFDDEEVSRLSQEFPKIDFDPDSKHRRLNTTELQAEEQYKNGNYKEALNLFKQCVRNQIENSQVRTVTYQSRIAECYEHMGRWQDAMKLLLMFGKEEFAKGNDSLAIILFDKAARLGGAKNDIAGSITSLDNLRRIYLKKFGPNSDEVYFSTLQLSNLYTASQKFAESERLLEQVSKIAATRRNSDRLRFQIIPQVYRADLLRNQGRKSQAEKILLENLAMLRSELRLRPNVDVKNVFFSAACAQTQIYLEDKKYQEALKLNSEAITVLQNNEKAYPSHLELLSRQREAIMSHLKAEKPADKK